MSHFVETPCKTFEAGGAVAQYLRVKFDTLKLAAAGIGEADIGTLESEAFADGDMRAVRLWSATGTRKMVAAGAITKHAAVYGAAGGKIDDTANGHVKGIALETAAADGDIIEVATMSSAMGAIAATAHVADASVAHALADSFNDEESEAALNALGVIINSILAVLENAGLQKSA